MIDQSPHQLAKARKKDGLKGVTILQGDAEDLPFETDSKDRYVSAGSIEYWPEPQRGICEVGLGCMYVPGCDKAYALKFETVCILLTVEVNVGIPLLQAPMCGPSLQANICHGKVLLGT